MPTPTASQLSAAKSLAASRGYDPALVDADNYDRVNTAFPVQGSSAPAIPGSVAGMGAASGTSAIPGVPGSGPTPETGGVVAPGGAPAPTTASVEAMNKVAEPAPDSNLGGLALGISALGGGAGGGSVGGAEVTRADATTGGLLRGMAVRRPSQEALVLGRRAY